MPPAIPADEKRHYLATLMRHIDPNESKAQLRAVLIYLVERSITTGDDNLEIPIQEVIRDVKEMPRDDKSANVSMSRVRDAVERFTASKTGRNQALRAGFKWGNQAIKFSRNLGERDQSAEEETRPKPLVEKFWAPYFQGTPARILYPEPLFVQDERGTFFRNLDVNSTDDKGLFGYLEYMGELRTSYPYVPAGIVRAMLRLITLFAANKTSLKASPIRAGAGARITEHHENLILLGTAASFGVVSGLESNAPRETEYSNPPLSLRLNRPLAEGVRHLEPTLMTRRPHLFRRHIMTVVNSHHSRGVEAIIRFLTSESDLEALVKHFTFADEFPKFCQVDFDVVMRTNEIGDPDADSVILQEVRTLSDN